MPAVTGRNQGDTMRGIIIVTAALALSLTACGKTEKQQPKPGPNFSINMPGAKASIGSTAPSNLPAYVEIFPGAEVVAAFTGFDSNQAAGTMTLKTKAEVQEVVDFYKKSMAKNGLAAKAEFTSGNVVTIAAENGDKMLTIIATKTDADTTIQVTYK